MELTVVPRQQSKQAKYTLTVLGVPVFDDYEEYLKTEQREIVRQILSSAGQSFESMSAGVLR